MQALREDGVHIGVFDHGQEVGRRLVATLSSAIEPFEHFEVLLHILGTMHQRARHFGSKDQEIGDVMGLVTVVVDVPIGPVR